MGRPATKPAKLKDGFYIEVKNPGVAMRMKMRSDSRTGMIEMARKYERLQKDVVILGEHKNNKWLDGIAAKAAAKLAAKAEKAAEKAEKLKK